MSPTKDQDAAAFEAAILRGLLGPNVAPSRRRWVWADVLMDGAWAVLCTLGAALLGLAVVLFGAAWVHLAVDAARVGWGWL